MSLLGQLVVTLPDFFIEEVIKKHMDGTDRAIFASVSHECREIVKRTGLRQAGQPPHAPLRVIDFVGSIERLAFAKESGCPWQAETCAIVARGGNLDVLIWARKNNCPWGVGTCAWAARGGHMKMLRWARANGCPWDWLTCAWAARGGHLNVLKWAREQDPVCPWNEATCKCAAEGGHAEVLEWAEEHGCPI